MVVGGRGLVLAGAVVDAGGGARRRVIVGAWEVWEGGGASQAVTFKEVRVKETEVFKEGQVHAVGG